MANMPPDRYEEFLVRQREYAKARYHRKKAEMTDEERLARNERERERYHKFIASMTDEEREAYYANKRRRNWEAKLKKLGLTKAQPHE